MDESLTLQVARADYYERNHFGADGGESLDWVPIKAFGVTFKIPNTAGRKRAVRIHDLHHVLTGYQTTFRGEAEIGAWELASGCLRWPAAQVLNTVALVTGMLIAPRRVLRAWARGRATHNLYAEDSVDHLLPRHVGEMRGELGLDAPAPRARLRDLAGVIATIVFAPLLAIGALVLARRR
jgi:hypothetical protein